MVKIYVKSTETMKRKIYMRGTTIKSFCEEIDMNFTYFSSMVNGNRPIGAANAKKIANALDVEMDELFDFRVPVK